MSDEREAILVTGAAGFIGSKLTKALLERGDKVIATDVAPPRQAPETEFYVADVRDITRHAPVIATRCKAIVHCGGISGPMLLGDNPGEVLDINIRGTSQLLSVAAASSIARFVGLSSVSAYGHTPGLDLVDETAPLTASTFYGSSKAAADLILQTYAEKCGLSAVALRIGWVYGPGRMTDALIQPIVRSAAEGPYRLDAGADHRLQFVHVDDVVAAIICSLEAAVPRRVAFNINGAETVRVEEMLATIAAQMPTVRARIGGGSLPGADIQGRMLLDAAAAELGWAPQISFSDGLHAYVEWLQSNPY
ncbi:NAD-dependent epimerase/dehydratase family protein [Rhizobium sp. NPDC090275]|uniref:NAD-dependent epimerase/dehydratase family protein n=1 Tax=Rhizobium sp. NPDC090275 TaxID=3364498 RepID=UPI00383ACE2E